MNVDDFEVTLPKGDKLLLIFNHQRDLMEKYHYIEEVNVGHKVPSAPYGHGLEGPGKTWKWLHAGGLDINDRAAQLRLKDFAWRITEEITEATEALEEKNRIHYLEELIDALHFSVELLCLCGISPENFFAMRQDADLLDILFLEVEGGVDPTVYLQTRAYDVIEALGKAMNMLKLKPWKTTAMITDMSRFKVTMISFFRLLIRLLHVSGFNSVSCAEMYLKKNAVNQFRQRSNY